MRRVSWASTRCWSRSRVCSTAARIASRVISWKTIRRTGTFGLEHLQQVPGDGLALAVLVCREEQLVRVLEGPLELGDLLLLVGVDDVERLEVGVHVDGELAEPALLLRRRQLGRRRQVADVADARLDVVARAEVALDRLRLGLATRRSPAGGCRRCVWSFAATSLPVLSSFARASSVRRLRAQDVNRCQTDGASTPASTRRRTWLEQLLRARSGTVVAALVEHLLDGRDQCAHGQRPVARTDQRGGRRVAGERAPQPDLLAQHDVLRVLGARAGRAAPAPRPARAATVAAASAASSSWAASQRCRSSQSARCGPSGCSTGCGQSRVVTRRGGVGPADHQEAEADARDPVPLQRGQPPVVPREVVGRAALPRVAQPGRDVRRRVEDLALHDQRVDAVVGQPAGDPLVPRLAVADAPSWRASPASRPR